MLLLVSMTGVGIWCTKPSLFPDGDYDPRLSGGMATVFDLSSQSFSHPIPGLSSWDSYVHEKGDQLFEQNFVAAPAPLFGGLGPVFNNVSCISCHHNDGKGTPSFGAVNSSMLMRVSLPGEDAHGGPIPVPGFGLQIQDRSLLGVQPEAKVSVDYHDSLVYYPDGSWVKLHVPTYTIHNPYISLPSGVMFSPRMAPPVFGMGLLARVPEAEILSHADPQDADGDGIRGHPNYVYDPVLGQQVLGRFGLKANVGSLLTQVASAFQQDMGITNTVFPEENVIGQPQADGLHDDPELADSLLQAVKFYVETLAVPARRNVSDPTVRTGEQLFTQIGCAKCHLPTLYTATDVRFPALSHQRIHPYTDLLLHDMGSALADGRPDYQASGQEWRTAPLWGIGLFPKTNGLAFYLHDGRAQSIEEAIIWHGGEAQQAKEHFMQLSAAQRQAVIAFLQSL
ncbi:MAG: c-type cytochrome [Thermoflavifilum sp.]|nr:c-type cytochrome [Thermoflavifilum sp.]